MKRVKDVEKEIQKLSSQELADFREWFADYDAQAWDRQLEADVKRGKLDAMANRALDDHQAGRSREL